MSKSAFPDIIGPSSVSANGAAPVLVRKRLNVVSDIASAVDNVSRRRIDFSVSDAVALAISATFGASGEWQPKITDTAAADLIRISSSVSGTQLTGLDFDAPMVRVVKFIANVGSNSIDLQPPASVTLGKAYFVNSYTLRPAETVRAVWDVVSSVYRLQLAATVGNFVQLDAATIQVTGQNISKP